MIQCRETSTCLNDIRTRLLPDTIWSLELIAGRNSALGQLSASFQTIANHYKPLQAAGVARSCEVKVGSKKRTEGRQTAVLCGVIAHLFTRWRHYCLLCSAMMYRSA